MRFILALLFAGAFGSVSPARATVYPERGNTEVLYLDGWETDLQVRLDLVRRAKTSIDLLSFSQAPDEIGRPFLDAIREVERARCVKVRYLYDGVASWIDRDFANESAKRITDGVPCGAQVLTLGVFDKWRVGLEWDDFFHEKVLIVDGGTADEKIVIGGRGYTRFSTRIADSGYLFRPIDVAAPSFGTDVRASFESLWKLALRFVNPLPRHPGAAAPAGDPSARDFATTEAARKESARIEAFLSAPRPTSKAPIPEGVYRPRALRLASNDLIEKVTEAVAHAESTERKSLRNDARSGLVFAIRKFSGTISLTSYAVGFTDPMREAFADFVRRGNTLEILTNGRSANARFIPMGLPVYYTAENLARLLSDIEGGKGKLLVRFLDADRADAAGRPSFVHRKLVLFDGAEKFLYTGTDNFTWSSSKKNDEWMIRIDDPRMVEAAKALNAREGVDYVDVPPEEIRRLDGDRPWLYPFVRPFIFRNY
ncbi:MAG: phosphatidylserine/phosphatidylglycerophosphate/cardiolipin synthase family protein [Bdellovibrionales bacterium]|nr:phosphatidylserine/phosphatidylglycerophosphate/cardiolipin synthase family protein [Bdellovibrionales bacterium]